MSFASGFRRVLGVVLTAIPVWIVPPPAVAQDAGDQARLAAVGAVRQRLEGGPVVLDATGLCTARLAEWSCPEPVQAELRRLGIALGGRAFTLVCPAGEQSCRLVRARHLVLLGPARIGARSGTVQLEVVSAGADSGSLLRREYVVQVARRGERWSVTEVN